MGVASLVHHPVQLPFPGLIKLFPPQFTVRKPRKSSSGRFSSSLLSPRHLRCPCPPFSFTPLESTNRPLGRIFSPIACYRDSGQDGVAYSEKNTVNEGSEAAEDVKSSSIHGNRSLGSHKESNEEVSDSYLSSIKTVLFWVSAAVAFGTFVGFKEGIDKASEFFAGYLLEQSLSVDNLFVFVLVFKYFKVPPPYQKRVLSYGIAGAIIFRAAMIVLGTATIERFEAVNLLLAAVLLYSSYKLFEGDDEEDDLSNNFILKLCQKFIPVTSYYDGDRFFTLQNGIKKATPLLLTVAVIELSDIAFAVDSIPAVFGVTHDPFIVFSSNLFAIVGLRSLYTLISTSMTQLDYLQPSIGVVLGFIGCKMILDFFGYHISTEVSLGFVAISLGLGIMLSLIRTSDTKE
ncbi:unnamed protein product [Victoria cruziana]